MIKDKFGQLIYKSEDIFYDLMKRRLTDHKIGTFIVEDIDESTIDKINSIIGFNALKSYNSEYNTLEQFDKKNQNNWYMPDFYKEFDIINYILDQCKTNEELDRCGEELILYQKHNLIDLLKYLKYLVDTMEYNNIIWGVGRGSSVASFVLYLLKIHKVNSLKYDLPIEEFFKE